MQHSGVVVSSRRLSRCTAALALPATLLFVAGCAAAPQLAYSPREIREHFGAGAAPQRAGNLVVPFEVSAQMVELAEDYTSGAGTDHGRANLLVQAITDDHGFGIEYNPVATTVARETVRKKSGNCLSMTSVFVGLARSLGITAYYVDASDRVNALTREEELLVDTGHIAATVRSERGWALVDFTGEITNYRTFRVIDDLEALAHFYNNRGYERIIEDRPADEPIPWQEALDNFTMAIAVDPLFSRAHNNLGVALARLGRDPEAEQSYQRAVEADESFAAPRHNLGNLYMRRGDWQQSIRWYGAAARLERNNPYLHYHLGLARHQAGDLEGAIEAFERAIALKNDYAEPRNLLAQTYRQLGRHEEAERVRLAGKKRGGIGG